MDGNDVIDSYDRYVVGNIFPNITGGFSTTFSYKKLVVVWTFLIYALGHTLYNDLKARTLGQYQGTWNIITDVKDMWTEDNPNTDLSKYYFGDQNIKKNITRSNNGLTAADNNNSHYYEKGDYLCLRELTLSYTLPKSLISKCFMTDASVYVTGQNLFYITGYEGTSPEPAVSTEYGRGIDNGRYPTPRTVLFGLSVSFLINKTHYEKILAYLMVGIAFTGCNSLDLEPISSIADNKYWQTEAQVDAFNVGLHSKFREKCSYSIFFFWRTSCGLLFWRVNIW
mgnify:CR=1 FL=1